MKFISAIFISSVMLSSCGDEYLDRLPTAYVGPSDLFSSVDNAQMAINGMARLMVNQYTNYGQVFCGEGTIKFINGEYMGEHFSRPNLASGWTNTMTMGYIDNNSTTYTTFPWVYYYGLIGNANEFLKAEIANVEGQENKVKFLRAQALVFRAYSYMQLIHFYCPRWADNRNDVAALNIGLILRTEENYMETDVPMSSANQIYAQIYSDLDEAISLFTSSGVTREKIWEPNVNVAYAVYARAAITKQDYNKAAEMAAKARQGYPLMSNSDYTSGFSSDNQEWIWGSYGGTDQTLHYYGFHSYMAYDANTSTMKSNPVCISKTLYDKIPDTDIRKELFLDPSINTTSSAPSATTGLYGATSAFALEILAKYPSMTSSHRISAYHAFKFSIDGDIGIGYINHFRSSEMYLIEAEAKYYLGGKENEIQTLMNGLIRDSKRDEAYECTTTGDDLLSEIKFYRAVELWGEGFDWIDKKRYNEPIVRVSFANGGSFYSTVAVTRNTDYKNNWVYVTPLNETQYNKALTK